MNRVMEFFDREYYRRDYLAVAGDTGRTAGFSEIQLISAPNCGELTLLSNRMAATGFVR